MTAPEHLAKIREGPTKWNSWRESNEVPRPNLREASLRDADLVGIDLRDSILRDANLSRANLTGANLVCADLRGAVLGQANLFRSDLSDVIATDAHLNQADLREVILARAHLDGANLWRANLRTANLHSARLREADLREGDLRTTNLTGADLTGAALAEADLSGANLVDTNLYQADLRGANLSRANLTGANLGCAKLAWTMLADVDLSEVKAMEMITHHGPSTIGVDTLHRSRGHVPEVFLRGCGFRDWELKAARLYCTTLSAVEITEISYQIFELRAGQALQYHSCFISHADEDQKFAERLYEDLQTKGVRCWFAKHDMQGGRKMDEQISSAIQFHDKLLLILSPASIRSEWVKFEIKRARQREVRERRRLLFPIRLSSFHEFKDWDFFDADTVTDLGGELRSYFIPDFSRWDLDGAAYERAFDKLVSNLRAASDVAASCDGEL